MGQYQKYIQKAAQLITNADALLLGISNGLSIAEGYNIFANNEMFHEQFAKFQERYDIRSVLQGLFYDFPDEASRQDFFKTLIYDWITCYRPSPQMRDLRVIVGDTDYFVVTSNGDTHLELSGFDPLKVFEIEGTFITASKKEAPVDRNSQLHEFITRHQNNNLTFLEIGIGKLNNLIKPFMASLASQLPGARYLAFNLPGEIYLPESLGEAALAVPGDLTKTLRDVGRAMQGESAS